MASFLPEKLTDGGHLLSAWCRAAVQLRMSKFLSVLDLGPHALLAKLFPM